MDRIVIIKLVEVIIRPSRYVTDALRWCGLGRPMKDREKVLRAFFMKSVCDFPTTKVLIENLKTNPSLRYLCGWEHRRSVPSEATFSRAFSAFTPERILEEVHAVLIREKYEEKLVGHVPIIDCNKRRDEYIPLSPTEQRRYCERSTVERKNSDLKDNYGARYVRVKGDRKV